MANGSRTAIEAGTTPANGNGAVTDDWCPPPAFQSWTNGRSVPWLSSNAGAPALPFQTWRHFKEAFAPELVARAVAESPVPVPRCLDPFGGSGTTALACQFLGIHPQTVEVNPYLADLIEAKLSAYDATALACDLGNVVRAARSEPVDPIERFAAAPHTFVEPGDGERWVFDSHTAARVASLCAAIDKLPEPRHKRFFRVLLGGILVQVSNVVVSGKGRRYRRGWKDRQRDPDLADVLFCAAARRAIEEVHRYRHRACCTYDLFRGDCREMLQGVPECDLAVFSPPYPNSFDYTDVYNLELWCLGYLGDTAENHALRRATMCSHVQISRDYPPAPAGSAVLDRVLSELEKVRPSLWDRWLPAMVGAYFADIRDVLVHLRGCIVGGGCSWLVVGDSSYGGVRVPTGQIVADLVPAVGWAVVRSETIRELRSAPQQQPSSELEEQLLVLRRL